MHLNACFCMSTPLFFFESIHQFFLKAARYGVDIQSDYVTFYYDRVMISQFPSCFNTGYHSDCFNRKMYVLIDLAYGRGGQSDYNVASLNNNPQVSLIRQKQ
jgi:hypothetical protein